MLSEDEIYKNIALILIREAPEDASRVILDAQLSREGDHCKFLFDYINASGQKHWFSPRNAKTDSELMDNLIDLRNIFIERRLDSGRDGWLGCVIDLDVIAPKIKVDFNYE